MSDNVYTIYHIPGVKVGCTNCFHRRKKEYPPGTKFEILEKFHGTPQAAGDKEWEYARKFGYPLGFHYIDCCSIHDIKVPKISTKTLETHIKIAESIQNIQSMQGVPVQSRAVILKTIRRSAGIYQR